MTSDVKATSDTPPVGRPVAAMRDDSTRYLCAAAHLDPDYADGAIREFLTEPLRAIPPSPGIDAVTVLREAVAARRRRLLRDWCLLGLFVLFAISDTGLALLWLVFGVVVSALWSLRSGIRTARNTLIWTICGVAVVAAAVWKVPGFATFVFDALTSTSIGAVPVVIALAALVVIVLDRLALSRLVGRSFARGGFVADPTTDTWRGERWVRTLGRRHYARELARIAAAGQAGNLVAYRGYEPFVGAGIQFKPMVLTNSLEPEEPDDENDAPVEPQHFKLAELYDHVSAQLMELRDSPSLSPSDRLTGLTERAQVVVSMEELLANYPEPGTTTVLPNPNSPPQQTIPETVLDYLIEHPLEWMRYYRCYQVETWNRDVTVSMFLHFGIGDRMLYLEWIPCVLFPIADKYRAPVASRRAIRGGLVEWVRLPGSLLFRLRSLGRIKRQPVGYAATYGTRDSLRELAAGEELNNYFQEADVLRYAKLMRSRMYRAVGQFLEEKGISVTEFMAEARAAGDIIITGDVQDSQIGGHHNRNQSGAKPANKGNDGG